MSKWLQVGIVGKAHGLRGHFYVSHRNEPLPDDLSEIRLGPDPDKPLGVHKILENSDHNGRPLLKVEGLKDRTQVELFTGTPLWIRRDEAADEEELLWGDLIGKRVIDRDSTFVGVIEDVCNFGANDSLLLRNPETNKTLFIALVPNYVDLAINAHTEQVHLTVTKDFFDEFWND